MNIIRLIFVCALYTSMLLSHTVEAAAFMQIQGVAGESQHPQHPGEVDVINWQWEAAKKVDVKSEGNNSPKIGKRIGLMEMTFRKHADSTSAQFFQHLANGDHFDQAVLTVRKAGQPEPRYIIFMYDVRITKYSFNDDADEASLTEDITLSFRKVDADYTETKDDGSQTSFKHDWSMQKDKKS